MIGNSNAMTCELFGEQLMAYLEHETDDATHTAMERHALSCAECGALLADLRKLRTDSANLPELQPSRDLWSGIAARIEAPVVPIDAKRGGGGDVATGYPAATRRWMRGAIIAASLVAAAGIGYLAAGGSRVSVGAPTPTAQLLADTPQLAVAPDNIPQTQSAEPGAERPLPSDDPTGSRGGGGPQASGAPTFTSAVTAPALIRPPEVHLAVATLTADYDREIGRLRVLIEQRRNQLDPATVAIIEKNLRVIDTAIEDCKTAIAGDPASRFLIESLNQSLRTKVELMRTAALLPSRT